MLLYMYTLHLYAIYPSQLKATTVQAMQGEIEFVTEVLGNSVTSYEINLGFLRF